MCVLYIHVLHHFFAYYLSHLMLHVYFINVILQILGQEKIRRKERKLMNRWYQVNKRDTEPETWCRVGTSQRAFTQIKNVKKIWDWNKLRVWPPSRIFQLSSREPVNGNANSEVNTNQKAEHQYNKKFGQPAEFSASWPNSAVLMDKIFPEIRVN